VATELLSLLFGRIPRTSVGPWAAASANEAAQQSRRPAQMAGAGIYSDGLMRRAAMLSCELTPVLFLTLTCVLVQAKPQCPPDDGALDTEQSFWLYEAPGKPKQMQQNEKIGKAGLLKLTAATKFLHKPPPLKDTSNRQSGEFHSFLHAAFLTFGMLLQPPPNKSPRPGKNKPALRSQQYKQASTLEDHARTLARTRCQLCKRTLVARTHTRAKIPMPTTRLIAAVVPKHQCRS
jgi:hypothetical protein